MVSYKDKAMQQPTDKFYNMQVNLIKNGRIYKEQVAIRNVWAKERSIFLDIYFHRLQKSFVFDSVFIHDISDLSRDKVYTDINQFFQDFKNITETVSEATDVTQPKNSRKDILSPIKDDIMLLLFMAYLWKDKKDLKEKIIMDYIRGNFEPAASLSERYIKTYVSALHPNNNDFYKILPKLKSKRPQEAELLLREAVKICLADGYLHYTERMYLADLMQALREEGLKIAINLP